MKKTLLVALALLSTTSAFASTITNGSFESNNVGYGGYSYADWGVQADGWSFAGQAGISSNNSAWYGTALDGNYFAFLQNLSSVSQSFTGDAGQYTISFGLAQRTAGCGCEYGAQTVNVTFDGQSLSLNPLQPTVDGNWNLYSFTVNAATSGTQTLAFNGLYNGYDSTVFVDNVGVAAAVPEADSYAMIALGLAMAGVIARRRAAKVS